MDMSVNPVMEMLVKPDVLSAFGVRQMTMLGDELHNRYCTEQDNWFINGLYE